MSKYDDLFDDTAPTDSVFVDKGVLDPLAEPAKIHAREAQERELATILNGVHEGDLPPTVSIYGLPGTGKTLTTRGVYREFAARHNAVAVEYVNLKEYRTLFSAANELRYILISTKKALRRAEIETSFPYNSATYPSSSANLSQRQGPSDRVRSQRVFHLSSCKIRSTTDRG